MSTNTVLRSIGYPENGNFTGSEQKVSRENLSVSEVNKMASLYVSNCDPSNDLSAHTLDQIAKWKQHPSKRHETISRFYKYIDQPKDCILVKSKYDFPADCSDTDILVDSPKPVSEIVSQLPDTEYEILGIAPTASTIRDRKTDELVDIQTDFGLHNIIYFNDDIVKNHIIRLSEFDENIPIAHRGVDIALHINHSITELMFTLKEYYTTVYFLETCTDEEFRTMVKAIRMNRTGYGASVFFGLVITLTEEIFGKSPARKEELATNFDLKTIEFERLHKNEYEMPHKYGIDTLCRYSISRLRQPLFVKSIIRQMIQMLDPRTAYYFTSKFYDRLTRKHYTR